MEYKHIYTKNIEILENDLTPQMKSTIEPIQTKIKNL
ncbi:hypothetical protein ACE4V3_04470 (plasmid) [Borrelia recurrentis]